MPFPDLKLNDGHKIPSIAFGSGSVNRGHDIHEYIEQAIDAGFSHLDTAQFYQNEDSVGRAIRESGLERGELYVTTKWGMGPVEDSIRYSLSGLGLKYVDLYLIHNGMLLPTDRAVENCWRGFEKAREDGLTKSIGVSNFSLDKLQLLLKIAHVKPAVHQISLNPYNYKEMKPLLEYHAKHNIVTEAYSSLAPITRYPGGPLDPVLQKIASKRGIAPSQVIFLWVKAKGAVIVTTTSKKDHLKEYLDVGDLDKLTDDEIESIEKAAAKFDPTILKAKLPFRRAAFLLFIGFFLAVFALILKSRRHCGGTL